MIGQSGLINRTTTTNDMDDWMAKNMNYVGRLYVEIVRQTIIHKFERR